MMMEKKPRDAPDAPALSDKAEDSISRDASFEQNGGVTAEGETYTPEEGKRVLRKIDFTILPMVRAERNA